MTPVKYFLDWSIGLGSGIFQKLSVTLGQKFEIAEIGEIITEMQFGVLKWVIGAHIWLQLLIFTKNVSLNITIDHYYDWLVIVPHRGNKTPFSINFDISESKITKHIFSSITNHV